MIKIVITVCAVLSFGALVTEGCIQCTSANDINCAASPASLQSTPCANTSSTCFSRITNEGITERGCTFELTADIQDTCTNATAIVSSLCLTCHQTTGGSVACNNEIYPSHRLACFQCNTDFNSTCGFNMTENTPTLHCPLYGADDRCFIRRFGDRIERGCVSSTSECNPPERCFICQGHGCNRQEGSDPSIPSTSNTLVFSSLLMYSVLAMLTFMFGK